MPTPAFDRVPAAPNEDPDNKPFFDAAREGKLLIGLCKDTGKHFFYPRGVSPYTLSSNVEFVESKGEGEIYSWSVQRGKEPYCLAYVTLTEGVTIMTNIVDTDLDAVKVGQKVKLVFKPTNGGAPVPMFTPA
jgi:uncharacterized OB-fold protein